MSETSSNLLSLKSNFKLSYLNIASNFSILNFYFFLYNIFFFFSYSFVLAITSFGSVVPMYFLFAIVLLFNIMIFYPSFDSCNVDGKKHVGSFSELLYLNIFIL